MNIDELLEQVALEKLKAALTSALSQVDFLFGQLEPYVDSSVLEKLKASYEAQIKRDIGVE